MFPHTPYSTRKGYLNKLGATIHLIGNKLEIGVPLDKRAQDDHINGSRQTSPNRASQPSWSHSLGPGTGGVSYIGSVGSVTPGRRALLVSLLATNLKESVT